MTVLFLVVLMFSQVLAPVESMGQEVPKGSYFDLALIRSALDRKAEGVCSISSSTNVSIEYECPFEGFVLGKYCPQDIPSSGYQKILSFYQGFIEVVRNELSQGRVVDYEVVVTGVSDGTDFAGTDLDREYSCRVDSNLGQSSFPISENNQDTRIALFRAITVWTFLYKEAVRQGFPMLFPRTAGSQQLETPGRVILDYAKEGAIGEAGPVLRWKAQFTIWWRSTDGRFDHQLFNCDSRRKNGIRHSKANHGGGGNT